MTERMVTITMQSAEYLYELHKKQKIASITPNMWKFIQEDLLNGINVAKGRDKSIWDREPTRKMARRKKVITADLPPPF